MLVTVVALMLTVLFACALIVAVIVISLYREHQDRRPASLDELLDLDVDEEEIFVRHVGRTPR